MGGSNGGLLVSTVMTQHPELLGAVVCQVPLIDMIAYTHIGAGASWAAEYGDPADPKMRAAILKYSPYQNVNRDTKYPPVFFVTATSDDRVTPVHARKMAAKMEEPGPSGPVLRKYRWRTCCRSRSQAGRRDVGAELRLSQARLGCGLRFLNAVS